MDAWASLYYSFGCEMIITATFSSSMMHAHVGKKANSPTEFHQKRRANRTLAWERNLIIERITYDKA
jgi:hypothetical protein